MRSAYRRDMRSRTTKRLAIAFACPWLVWAAVRLAGWDSGYPLVPAMAFTPYAALSAVLPLVAGAVVRSRAAIAITLTALVAFGLAVVPRGFGSAPDVVGGQPLTVASVNMFFGGADPVAVAAHALDLAVDILTIQELTPEALAGLLQTDLATEFQYRLVSAEADSAGGGGVFSRYPLEARDPVAALFRQPRADIRLPSGDVVTVTSVHAFPPATSVTAVRQWADDLAALPSAGGLEILAGDFNATLDHAALRDIIDTGYADAAAAVGRGWTPTWSVGFPVPPPLTLDHVLVSPGIAVLAVSVRDIPGTDHRLVSAELRL